jgi:hypothetical protein
MGAVWTKPEMQQMSVLSSQELLLLLLLLLLLPAGERKLKSQYFIIPELTAEKSRKFGKVLNHLSYFLKSFFFADCEV